MQRTQEFNDSNKKIKLEADNQEVAIEPLEKLWSEEDIWGIEIVEEKLEKELAKINFNEIESKLFQCISVNGINIKSSYFRYKQGPNLLIDRLDKSLSNCLGSLEAILGFSDL
ncbi:hypothetical protein HDU92_004618, partial [Lobulomyces angularis]